MDTEETASTRKNRDKRQANLKPHTPWKKGESGNPNGRPRGSVNLTNYIKRKLKEVCDQPGADGKLWAELFSASLIANAMKGNGSAIKEIMARVDGPIPTVHEGGDPKKPIRVTNQDILTLINNPAAVEAADKLLDLLGHSKTDAGGPGMDREREEV